MGNSPPSLPSEPRDPAQDSRKHLYVLYNGQNELQRNNARAFRDALRAGDGASNMRIETIDVSSERFDALHRLRDANRLIVLCVAASGIEYLRGVVNQTGIRDAGPDGTMDMKVLTVSFGTTPPINLMGADILTRLPLQNKRDFCFGFDDRSQINPNQFDGSLVMRALRATIQAIEN